MVAAAVIAVAIVTALALTRDPSARSSVALSAAPAQPAMPAPTLESEAAPRQLRGESRDDDPVERSVATMASVPTGTAVPQKPKPLRDTRLVTPSPLASASVAAPLAQPSVAPVPEAPVAKPVAAEAEARTTSPEASRSADAQTSVTITGCLETDGERFRLTETDGAEAPKARGWRSGFLKKRPAPVELVAFSDPAALRKYVGHRVVATGPLESRALQVHSFRPAGAMCD